jgi:serine O-acetyltransferase
MNELLDESLDRITDGICASYRSDARTQRVGHAFLPSRERIVELLERIRQLLFPGFFGPKAMTDQSIRYHVGNLLVQLGEDLAEQVYNCLCYAAEEAPSRNESRLGGGEKDRDASCRARAARIAKDFLDAVPELREALALDAQAAYDGDPAAKSIDEVIYCYPGFHAVAVYRVAHQLHCLGVPLMPRIMTEHAHSVTGTDIHPGAQIGKSFFIDHATGVVIGETTRIGDNVKVYQGVTLGAMSFPKDERGRVIKGLQRHPTIEDNVTIYANATILGGQTVIGRGVTVGGNSFVTQSVTADSTVVSETPQLRVRSKRKRSS